VDKLEIDKEFKSLIPPLTPEEYQQLEANILKDGCLHELILWDKTIIDGHNRYEICSKHNISFKARKRHFDNRDEVKEWIILNQFGRRNLSPYQRSELALKLKPLIQVKAKENQKEHGGTAPGKTLIQNTGEVKSIRVDKELAKIAGVGHDTIYKVEQIQKHAHEDIKEKVKSGEISIRQGYLSINPKKEDNQVMDKPNKLETKEKEVIKDIKKEVPNTSLDTSKNSLPISLRHIQLLVNNFLADADRYLFMPEYVPKLSREEKDSMIKEIDEIKNWHDKFKKILIV
jgi:hypothetical protein